jgi:putative oxidoreductase
MISGPIRTYNGACRSALPVLALVGRILLVYIFFDSGFGRLTGGYEASAHLMQQHGVPSFFLPFATALEFLGSLFIALGLLTRLSALGLAVFSVAAGFLFYGNFSNDTDWIGFLDCIGLAGGLLVLMAFGPGRWSLDKRLNLED